MTGYIISSADFSVKDALTLGSYAFTWRADLSGKSTVTVPRAPVAAENDFFFCEEFFGVIETVKSARGAAAYTISLLQPEYMFSDDAILSTTAEIYFTDTGSTTMGVKQILDENYANTSDPYLHMPYLSVTVPDPNTPYNMCPEYDDNRKFNVFEFLSWIRSASYQWPQNTVYLKFTPSRGALSVEVIHRAGLAYTPEYPALSSIAPVDLSFPAFAMRSENYSMNRAAEAEIIYTNTETEVSTSLRYYLLPDGTVTQTPSANRLRGKRVIDTAEGTSQSAASLRAKEILSESIGQHSVSVRYDGNNPTYVFCRYDVGRRYVLKTALGVKYSTLDELTIRSDSAMIDLTFGVMPTKLTDMLAANEKRLDKAAQESGGGGGGSAQQVQTDWNETDVTAPSYLKNKPTVPDCGMFYIEGEDSVAADTTSPYYAARWKGRSDNVTELYTGLTIIYKIDVAGHATYGTVLDINGLGEHPVTRNVDTAVGTAFPVGSSVVLTYDADVSASVYRNSAAGETVAGCWKVADYASTANYQMRKNSGATAVASNAGTLYRYELCMTDKNGELVPFNNVSNARTTYTKAMNAAPFDPFGRIYWYYTTGTVTAGANASAPYLYNQVAYDVRYSLNINSSGTTTGSTPTALTAQKPVYLRVLYDPAAGTATFTQDVSSGSYLERSSIVQELPASDPDASRTDGKKTLYIYLGQAYSKYQAELSLYHPVFAYSKEHSDFRHYTQDTAAASSALRVHTGVYASVNGVITLPIDTTKFRIVQLTLASQDFSVVLGAPKSYVRTSDTVLYEVGTLSTFAMLTEGAQTAVDVANGDTSSTYYNNGAVSVTAFCTLR